MKVTVKTIKDVHVLDILDYIDEIEYFYMFGNIPMKHIWYPKQGILKMFAFKNQAGDPKSIKTKDEFIQHVLKYDYNFR